MPYVEPSDLTFGQLVDEDDWNVLTEDIRVLAAALVPPGSLIQYGGSSVPDGWLLCDGSAVSRVTYSVLFGIVGTTFGPGDGSTTFHLPDMRFKFPLGKAASGTGSTLGGTGGSADAINVSHSHTQDAHNHGSSGTQSADHSHSGTTSTDGSHAHDPSGGGSGDWGFRFAGGTNGLAAGGAEKASFTSMGAAGSHSHTMSTGGASANHTHTVGNATATNQTSGSSGTGANLPPFVALTFIIKT